MKTVRYMRSVTVLVVAIALGGCASLWSGNRNATPDEDVVAEDFLNVLVQLDGTGPDERTLRFQSRSIKDDPFTARFEALARARGYAVQTVPGSRRDDTFVHDVTTVDKVKTETREHTISVGSVQLRRRYALNDQDSWVAAGAMLVRGADPSGVELDEKKTRQTTNGANPKSKPEPIAEPIAVPDPGPNSASTTQAKPAPTNQLRPLNQPPATPRVAPEGRELQARPPLEVDPSSGKPSYGAFTKRALPVRATANVLDRGSSNYDALFSSGYGNIDEVVLIFPNDSLRLGDANKANIHRTLKRFDPDTDVFSVVGCSLGTTRIKNGNEALALGRANRVKEELLFAGVSAERILDEGCWAGESSVRFPARGVVLTLKRQAG